jgi:hypothetical protein
LEEQRKAPPVSLSRLQWLRLAVVGIFVVFAVVRVVPDVMRLWLPLGAFGYVTDEAGVVERAPPARPKGSDELRVGDRIRIDRIPPFDRKPGLARVGYTRENFDRRLPIERNGQERIVRLHAVPESPANRAVTLLRIIVLLVSVGLGAILVLVKPNLATAAFFVFALGSEGPTTFADTFLDVPWREIPQWIGDTLRGAAGSALLLFAVALSVPSRRGMWLIGGAAAALAITMGTLHAAASWRLTYAGSPAPQLAAAYEWATLVITVLTFLAFATAFIRARGAEHHRTGWILASFVVAGAAHVLSDQLFPTRINFWQNSILLSTAVIPVIVVWIAVVRHHFFDVDFVVSRALVYTAITFTVIGVVGASEELITYVFYNNTDLATGLVVAISLVLGALLGKIKGFLEGFVNRFLFRERSAQRRSLDRIAANMLEANSTDVVFGMLLHDAPSVLDLSFGGILMYTPDGAFELAQHYQWPEGCLVRLDPDNPLTVEITQARGMVPLDGGRNRVIRSIFPDERFTFAAPIYFDRGVTALVMYGRSASGIDLDPEERVLLLRVVAHASLALAAIELSRLRATASASVADAIVARQPQAPEAISGG